MSVQSRDLVVRLMAQSNGFEKGMKSAAASADVFAKELEKLDRRQTEAIAHVARLRAKSDREATAAAKVAAREAEVATQRRMDAYAQVGKAAMVSGAAMAAGLAIATGAALSWESAWAGVTKTVDGSAEQMQILEEDLRELAKTLPATHSEIAAVAEAAGQLGVRREDITSFTKVMIDLGETTNLTADEAATAIAQMANVMGTAGEDVDNLASTLVALGNDGASTEKQILDMALRLSGAGKLIGASEGEILAMANALASMGIEAELGGGAMSRTLLKIFGAVKAGGEEVAGFARVAGMSAQQFSEAFANDPIRAVDAFVQGLNRVDESGGNVMQVLSDLGIEGTQDLQVLLRLKGAGDLLAGSLALQAEAWEANIALAKEANKRYETTEAKLAIARNTLNDFAIDMGSVLLPALASAAGGVADLATWLGDLPQPVQTALVVLGSLGATVGLVGGAAMLAVPQLAAMKASMVALGVTAGTTDKVMKTLGLTMKTLGAAALVGGVVVAIDQISSALADAPPSLNAFTDGLADFARDGAVSGDAAKVLGEDFSKLDDTLQTAAKNKWLAGAFGPSLQDTRVDIQEAREVITGLDQALAGLVRSGNAEMAAQLLADMATESGKTEQELTGRFTEYNDALTEVSAKTKLAADSQGLMGDAAMGAAGAIATETKSLQDLLQEVQAATDLVLGLRDASRGYEASLDAATESLKENGKTLDINTAKGRDNEAALDAIATAAAAALEQMVANNAPAAQLTKRFQEQRTALIKAAESFGMTTPQAKKYADSVLRIPDTKTTNITLVGALDALRQIESVKRALGQIPKSISTQVFISELRRDAGAAARGPVQRQADGGLVDYYADGGLREQHVAQIAPAGSWRVWAEPETGGEAYIPLAPSKRARSVEIWQETGRRLQMLANGAVTKPSSRLPSPTGGRPLSTVAAGLSSIEQVRALVDAWEDYNEQLAQAARRQELALDEKAARGAFDLAKGMRARTEALEDLKGAQQRLREFDAAAAVDRERRAVDKILDTLGAEEKAREAATRAAEELADARERDTEAAEDAQERALDRLNKLLDSEKALRGQQLQATQRAAADRARLAQRAQQETARFAAEQLALQARQVDAERRHLGRLADLRVQLADDESRLLADRRDRLAGSTALDDMIAFERGLPADWLVANARHQVEALAEWMDELAAARGRGVSEQVIIALGLDEGPQTLAQVRALTRASAEEIAELNDAVEQRTRAAGEQVRREQVGNYGQLGQALTAAQQQYAAAVLELQGQYRAEQDTFALDLIAMQDEFVQAQQQISDELTAVQATLVEDQERLAAELAALGTEQGRAYGEALAEGLRSQIPAVRAAAAALAEAMAALGGAQSAAAMPSASAPGSAGNVFRNSPLERVRGRLAPGMSDWGSGPADASNPQWVAWMAAGGRTATYDVGGWLQPGYTLAYNGTGQPERILTAQQMGGASSRVVQFMPGAEVTIRESVDVDLLLQRAEFLVSAGGFE